MTRAELVQAYRDAIYTVTTETGTATFRIDQTAENIDVLPRCTSVTIITAFNPNGFNRSPAENEQAHERLLVYLREQGLRFSTANGASPTDDHEEKSLAVYDLSEDEARALGARFGQLAVVYWDGGEALLVWMDEASKP